MDQRFEYFRRRLKEEQAAVDRAATPATRHLHQQLANLYASELGQTGAEQPSVSMSSGQRHTAT